jgi:hypothetical protein
MTFTLRKSLRSTKIAELRRAEKLLYYVRYRRQCYAKRIGEEPEETSAM